MRVNRGHPDTWPDAHSDAAVTIGVFDGVHIGHRSLIARLGEDMERTVLTFEPHPVEVLRPGIHPRLITTIDERLAILETLGVGHVGVLDLIDIKQLDPREFMTRVLTAKTGMRRLVCGPDFRFGKDRSGDVATLEAAQRDMGFVVDVAPLISDPEGVLSSSRIRSLIEAGDVDRAGEAMGSPFRLTGVVIHGDKRGSELGFPTANIAPPPRKVIPAIGVYAARALVGSDWHPAAVNIGSRPTFGAGDLLVEAHLLDFDSDIYGETVAVELDRYLRPEIAFSNVADLVDQMGRDVAQVGSSTRGLS